MWKNLHELCRGGIFDGVNIIYRKGIIMTCQVIITEEENWNVAKDINSEVNKMFFHTTLEV
jgi:hypothetical protein